MTDLAATCAYIGLVFWLLSVGALAVSRRVIFGQPKPAIIPDTQTHSINPITFVVDGAALQGWLAMPKRAPGCAILYFNGRHENPTTLFAILHEVPEHAVMVFHRRGLGSSGGWPSEQAHVRDGLVALDWFCKHLEISPAAVTIVGRSLGSGVAVRVSAARDVCGLVLLSAFDRLVHVIGHRYPWLPEFLIRDKFDSARHVAAIRCPCLSIVGDRDCVIPPRFSRALFAHWEGSLEELVIAGGEHRGLLRNPSVCLAIATFARRYQAHAAYRED